ncbi:PilX N-terminal domain-containing pilus assembly protein, partial [Halomonas sp. BC04]|uniref:PilX N-terminal domain-containing pilus assembly protein n=1 Tax=Halomonas sp. BC04 TaxID=1403540 RepID=UPI0012DDD6AF
MKKQRGAALVVVLSLLTMSLMLGLSGMQSSLVDERLAGNYKAQTEAQMAAEQAATEGFQQSSGAIFDDTVPLSDILVMSWEDFVGGDHFSASPSESVCTGRLECRYRYIEDGSKYVASMGRVFVGDVGVAESEPILVRLVTLTIPNINGAHTCYGEDCSYDSGGNSELTGIDHPVPDNSSCNGGACRTDPDEDEENRNDVAQCFYPDTSESGSFGHCKPGEEAL